MELRQQRLAERILWRDQLRHEAEVIEGSSSFVPGARSHSPHANDDDPVTLASEVDAVRLAD